MPRGRPPRDLTQPYLCRHCGVKIKPKAWQIVKRDYECADCCRSENAKRTRKYNDARKLSPLYMRRQSIWNKVWHAIKKGLLVKKPCEVCGAKRVEAHHDDYRKPLSVRWLCSTHHREHHRATGEKGAT
jgi:hypothetical protein